MNSNSSSSQNARISPKILIGGGIAVLLVIISAGFLLLSSGSNPTSQMQRLGIRFDTLQSLIAEGSKNIQNGDLRKINTDARIILASDIKAIGDAMSATGLKEAPDNIVAAETDQDTFDKLTDALANGRFDTVYQTTLVQKLEETSALMREIHDKTKSRSLKTALAAGYEHINGTLDQLSKVNG